MKSDICLYEVFSFVAELKNHPVCNKHCIQLAAGRKNIVHNSCAFSITAGNFLFMSILGDILDHLVLILIKQKINTLKSWNKDENANTTETKSCPVRRQERNIVKALTMAISEDRVSTGYLLAQGAILDLQDCTTIFL